MGRFLVGDEDLYRVAGHHVGTADQERFRFFVQLREDGAHGNLDFFRRGFTYFNHVLLTQVVLDIGRENVAGHTHGILHHNAAQGDDGDFRGTTSNVYHHIALRRLHIQADTQGCCHGLIDEVYVPAAGVLRGVADGTDFHLRGAGRNAHHQFEVGGEQAAVTGIHLLDEAADHHFRGVEVCNDAIPQGTHRLDAGIGFLVHEFGLLTQGNAFAGLVVDGHYRGLVQGNLVILENDGVGGTQVDSQFLIQKVKCHN